MKDESETTRQKRGGDDGVDEENERLLPIVPELMLDQQYIQPLVESSGFFGFEVDYIGPDYTMYNLFEFSPNLLMGDDAADDEGSLSSWGDKDLAQPQGVTIQYPAAVFSSTNNNRVPQPTSEPSLESDELDSKSNGAENAVTTDTTSDNEPLEKDKAATSYQRDECIIGTSVSLTGTGVTKYDVRCLRFRLAGTLSLLCVDKCLF